MKYVVSILVLCMTFAACKTTRESLSNKASSLLSTEEQTQVIKTTFKSEKAEVDLMGEFLNPEKMENATVKIEGISLNAKWDGRATAVGDEKNQICHKLVKCKMRWYSSEDVDLTIEWPDADSIKGEQIGAFIIRYRDEVNPHSAEVGQFIANGVFNGVGYNVAIPGKGIIPETVDYLRVEIDGKIVRPVWDKKTYRCKCRKYINKDMTISVDWPLRGSGAMTVKMEKLNGWTKDDGVSKCEGSVDNAFAAFELNSHIGIANLSIGEMVLEHSGYTLKSGGKNYKIECLKNEDQSTATSDIERLLWRCQAENENIKTINIKLGGPFEKPTLYVKTKVGEYYLGCLFGG